MAFIKSPQSPLYFAPAVYMQLSEGGALLQHKFDVQCRRHTKSQLAALDAEVKAIATASDRDRKVFEAAIVGWRAVQDAQGVELPFSVETAEATEEQCPGFIASCVRAFYLSIHPVESAHLAAKN